MNDKIYYAAFEHKFQTIVWENFYKKVTYYKMSDTVITPEIIMELSKGTHEYYTHLIGSDKETHQNPSNSEKRYPKREYPRNRTNKHGTFNPETDLKRGKKPQSIKIEKRVKKPE